MAALKRILLLLAAFGTASLYLWYAAVRAAPDVKRRKVERRRRAATPRR
ncbi:MAG TPA: hypothetical protein VH950_00480 [Gaiellaceae bacterium]